MLITPILKPKSIITKMIQKSFKFTISSFSSFTQGQMVIDKNDEPIREYFYHIDHQGQLFLDDTKIKNFTSCFKEQSFLDLFFRSLKCNLTDRFKTEYPFIYYCNGERNYLKCDDLPYVLTTLDTNKSIAQLNQLNSVNWSVHFDPAKLFHHEKSGRLYYLFENQQVIMDKVKEDSIENKNHPYERMRKRYFNLPCKVALVKSSISIELLKNLKINEKSISSGFEFDYNSNNYTLNSNIKDKTYELIKNFSSYKELDE